MQAKVYCSKCEGVVKASKLYAAVANFFRRISIKPVIRVVVGMIFWLLVVVALYIIFPGASKLGYWVGTSLFNWKMPTDWVASPAPILTWLFGWICLGTVPLVYCGLKYCHYTGKNVIRFIEEKFNE
jgi:hypothetical protein